MKRIPILPTMVTLGNALFGFLSIGCVLRAHAMWAGGQGEESAQWMGRAGWLIFAAMVCDALDGKIARLTRSASAFGVELDSLCDVISFGVAPGVIVIALAAQQGVYYRLAWAAGGLYVLCAALRLARFNVETGLGEEAHQSFKGLPSPAAAAFIASITTLAHAFSGEAEPEFKWLAAPVAPYMDGMLAALPFVAVILAVLMVSRVRYVHVVSAALRGHEPLDYLVKLVMLAILAVLSGPFSLPLLVGGYVASGVVLAVKDRLLGKVPAGGNPTDGEGAQDA